jgi:hypothetical protein
MEKDLVMWRERETNVTEPYLARLGQASGVEGMTTKKFWTHLLARMAENAVARTPWSRIQDGSGVDRFVLHLKMLCWR